MNDERCVRDRVTAILTLADELAVMPPDHPERCYVELRFRTEARACLLEALDTIDRLEAENEVAKNLLTDVVNPDNDEPALGRAMSAAEDWLWKDLT